MLTKSKVKAILSGQTVAAQKVYEAIPVAQSWETTAIVTEVHRLGYGLDYRTIAGCINTLIRAGLAREIGKGNFIREKVKPDAEPCEPIKNVPSLVSIPTGDAMLMQVKPTEKTAIDRLLELSIKATAIAKQVQELAAEISDCAVVVETQMNTESEEIKKLRTLREVLKNLN